MHYYKINGENIVQILFLCTFLIQWHKVLPSLTVDIILMPWSGNDNIFQYDFEALQFAFVMYSYMKFIDKTWQPHVTSTCVYKWCPVSWKLLDWFYLHGMHKN